MGLHLTLWLDDGMLIGNSRLNGEPTELDFGDPRTNPPTGLQEGIMTMNEGGIRILVVPPELGYGDEEVYEGGTPPNSRLVYRIDLISVSAAQGRGPTSG